MHNVFYTVDTTVITPPDAFQKVTLRMSEGAFPLPIISLEFVLQLEQTGNIFLVVCLLYGVVSLPRSG